MKSFNLTSLFALCLFVPGFAHANDIQSVIQRLELAERSIQTAQQEIGQAKMALYALLQRPTQGTLCVYNYFGKQYHGRGDTENEATENAIFQCSADKGNVNPGDCRYWSNKNGNVQCRVVNN